MRPARPIRRATVALLAALSLAAVSGCSGDDPVEATPATTTASVAATPSATPTPTAAAAPVELPESALKPIKGTTYEPIPDAPAMPEELASQSEVLAGYVSRALAVDGETAGAVQLMRMQPDLATDPIAADGILPALFEAFAGTSDFEQRTFDEGRLLLVADDVQGQGVGSVAFRDGADLVLITTSDADTAVRLATAYATGKPI